jgi:hypothetical protein
VRTSLAPVKPVLYAACLSVMAAVSASASCSAASAESYERTRRPPLPGRVVVQLVLMPTYLWPPEHPHIAWLARVELESAAARWGTLQAPRQPPSDP